MFGDPVVVDARLPAWLERLGTLYEIAWATTWGEMANDYLSPPLGLPPLRVVSVHESTSARRADAKSRHGSDRLPSVLDFIRDRCAAWVDDEVTEATVAFGRRRQPSLLVVRTTPHVGLSLAQFEELVRFDQG